MRMELMRLFCDEQVRNERRKPTGTAIESAATVGLKPWREVVMPHKDLASSKTSPSSASAPPTQKPMSNG